MKPKTSATSNHISVRDGARDGLRSRNPKSALLICGLGVIAIIIAVFGQPAQALAAAVIVVALCALAQGRSVTQSTADEVRTILQLLQGKIAEGHWTATGAGEMAPDARGPSGPTVGQADLGESYGGRGRAARRA